MIDLTWLINQDIQKIFLKNQHQMSATGLGIDTTFDDTSVSVLRGKREILANLTLSQYKEHEEFGGVVPERASRKHLEVIHLLIDDALKRQILILQELITLQYQITLDCWGPCWWAFL